MRESQTTCLVPPSRFSANLLWISRLRPSAPHCSQPPAAFLLIAPPPTHKEPSSRSRLQAPRARSGEAEATPHSSRLCRERGSNPAHSLKARLYDLALCRAAGHARRARVALSRSRGVCRATPPSSQVLRGCAALTSVSQSFFFFLPPPPPRWWRWALGDPRGKGGGRARPCSAIATISTATRTPRAPTAFYFPGLAWPRPSSSAVPRLTQPSAARTGTPA